MCQIKMCQITMCQITMGQITISQMSINHNVSNYIHRSLMPAVVGEKSLVILLSMGVHSGLTLGPLYCLFMGGL